MKTALDYYSRGKQKESNADDYNVNSYYHRGRFICPECGEDVHLRKSKYSNYFAHYKKTDATVECDRRIVGMQADSIYERMGIPMYIRHSSSKGYYNLYLGFKALPQSVMDDAEKINIAMTIDGKNRYLINRERFSMENMVLVPVKHIPPAEHKYNIYYSPADKAKYVVKHWSNFSDGFSFAGSLFTVTDQGGRKIRHGDNISTDVEYYWVRRDKFIPHRIPGIHMREHGRLVIDDENWYVFKGYFSSNISDREFERLTAYLKSQLQVYLLEKEPKFIPLWPPLIRQEDSYLIDSRCHEIYGYVSSGNDDPKVYIYRGATAVPEEIPYNNRILSVKVNSVELLINIDRKYISGGFRLGINNSQLVSEVSPIELVFDEQNMRIENRTVELSTIPNEIKNIENLSFVIVRENGEITFIDKIEEFPTEKLNQGDYIYILSGMWIKRIIHIKKEDNNVSHINEKLIENKILTNNGTAYAVLPHKLRAKLMRIEWENKTINKYFDECLNNNKIPIYLIGVLEEVLHDNT